MTAPEKFSFLASNVDEVYRRHQMKRKLITFILKPRAAQTHTVTPKSDLE